MNCRRESFEFFSLFFLYSEFFKGHISAERRRRGRRRRWRRRRNVFFLIVRSFH